MSKRDFWKGKRVFLTGHTGFKGSWLSLWLLDMGAIVKGFSLEPPTDPSLFEALRIEGEIEHEIGDVRDPGRVDASMRSFSPEIVIHMAAQPLVRESYTIPVETFSTNVMGTVHVLEAVRRCPEVRSVVVVTTDKCYENREWVWGYRENEAMGGHDPYSASKGCAELVTSAYRRSFFCAEPNSASRPAAVASARAGNVIGGGDWAKDRLIPDILAAVTEPRPVIIRSPSAIRPWQHVLEPLAGYLQLAKKLYEEGQVWAEAWNFGPDESDAKPVEWIVGRMCELWPGNKGYEIDSRPQPHEARYLKLDCSKARQVLGWRPRWDLDRALREIISWASAHKTGADMREVSLRQIRAYEASAFRA